MDYRKMTIEEMRERKKEQRYTYEKLAELTGLPTEMIYKTLEGEFSAADDRALRALEEVFVSRPARVIREAQTAYLAQKRQGEFTVQDYYALPDERRVELIDGVIYDMSSPTNIHQAICGEVFGQFRDYIRKKKGMCFPMCSPIDVQLDCDNKTMVQPDVVIVCDRNKFVDGKIVGAPDFVLEVLSKSTRKRDTTKKLEKYANAGVREYWIVDPEQKRVIVYEFENEKKLTIYGFDDKISVGIFGGDCIMNFGEVYENVKFLYISGDTP